MLTFRKLALAILTGSMSLIALAWLLSILNIWMVFVLITVNAAVIISASFIVCSGFYMDVICSGNTTEDKICITFDDGPDPIITPRVLDLLEEYDAKAGFFLKGKNIEGNEDIVRRMANNGHSIGNHSFSHDNLFGFFSAKRITAELQKTRKLIEDISGKKSLLFRPPFGVTNPNIAKAVRSLGYIAVGWNIRSMDGIKHDENKVVNKVLGKLQPGSIILFHDNHEGIFNILEIVIESAHREGYAIVPLEDLLNNQIQER